MYSDIQITINAIIFFKQKVAIKDCRHNGKTADFTNNRPYKTLKKKLEIITEKMYLAEVTELETNILRNSTQRIIFKNLIKYYLSIKILLLLFCSYCAIIKYYTQLYQAPLFI